MRRAHGVDVSKYDGSFAPEQATGPVDFAIQRLSYVMRPDEKLEVLAPPVQRVPIRGAYHYLSTGAGWREQADFFLSLARRVGAFHFYACDFEEAYNNLSMRFVDEAWNFIQYVQDRTGKRCLIYTNPSLYSKWIARGRHPWHTVSFWVAQYWFFPSPNKNPGMPRERKDWTFWQYSPGERNTWGPRYGVGRRGVDVDVFNGDVAALRAWAGVEETAQPPEPSPPDVVHLSVRTLVRVRGAQAEVVETTVERVDGDSEA